MRFLRGRDGGGEEEDKYHNQSKEARNVDSLLSLKVSFADFYVCDCFETTVSTSCRKVVFRFCFFLMQDSGSYSIAPESQSSEARGLELAFGQTSLSLLHAKCADHRLNYGTAGGTHGAGRTQSFRQDWSSICQTLF